MKHALGALLFAWATLSAATAFADPRLDEKVYLPTVETHVLELETRLGSESGGPLGGANTFVGEMEYGVNRRLSLALVATASNDPHEAMTWRGVGVEGVYTLGKIPLTGIDTAAYVEYTRGLNGESDGLEAKLLAARRFGPVRAVLNLIAERPIGGGQSDDVTYGYAAGATVRVAGRLRIGAEAFGDLGSDHAFLRGRQGAYAGPAAQWEWRPHGSPVEFDFDIGWLKALSADRAEADSQFRLGLEIEKPF